MSSRTDRRTTAREKAAEIRAQQARAERQRRVLLASAALIAVVAIVAGMVLARLTTSPSSSTPTGTAGASLLSTVSSVPATTLDRVGAGTAQGGPRPIHAPTLTAGGKPKLLYVGAEYCPYCAAERWALAVALSRFGTLSNLGTTHSASGDVFPNTPTLSFHGAGYTSKFLSFTGYETSSNQVVNGSYAPLDTPPSADEKTFRSFDRPPYVTGQAGAIPFIDIGGIYISSGATYTPQLLAGKTHQQVADALSNPQSPIAQAVDGSANLFTAAICRATNDKPGNVCTSSGVQSAAARLGGG